MQAEDPRVGFRGGGVPVWVVDSFTDRAFSGNPAAVCVLRQPAPEGWMQAVAAEMRHSETAFVHPEHGGDDAAWRLRWFTPVREVDLCGHATLATAHVLWTQGLAQEDPLLFMTRSGRLACERTSTGIAMRLPAKPAAPLAGEDVPPGLFDALGIAPVPVHATATHHLLLEMPDVDALDGVRPDFRRLRDVSDRHGYILAAAAGEGAVADVACRYFVPAWGIDEDPATGSIQCVMAPFWCGRLGQRELVVEQRSGRGGLLRLRWEGEHVVVSGAAVTVLRGELLPADVDGGPPV